MCFVSYAYGHLPCEQIFVGVVRLLEHEMGPSKEVVTANGMEEGGPGGVPCASMEKGQLFRCSCKIVGIVCSCLWDHVRTAWLALQRCVVQRDHVEVIGGVFCS